MERARATRALSAALASRISLADAGLSPTRYQADSFPPELRQKLKVIHDGIDTDTVRRTRELMDEIPHRVIAVPVRVVEADQVREMVGPEEARYSAGSGTPAPVEPFHHRNPAAALEARPQHALAARALPVGVGVLGERDGEVHRELRGHGRARVTARLTRASMSFSTRVAPRARCSLTRLGSGRSTEKPSLPTVGVV